MVLSDEKITHLSHLILNHLKAPQRARLKVEEPVVLREIKRLLVDELRVESDVDVVVRRRLASYSKPLRGGDHGMGDYVPQGVSRGNAQTQQGVRYTC